MKLLYMPGTVLSTWYTSSHLIYHYLYFASEEAEFQIVIIYPSLHMLLADGEILTQGCFFFFFSLENPSLLHI